MNETSPDGIVLLAKKPGLTSFSSLNSIKKAIGTKKVGHTGTLDSFAQGLLVVCTGRLTRLAGNIIEFDKEYRAVIKFGQETDTLEYTGKVIKEAPLPKVQDFENAVKKFTGDFMQKPPVFSAIHVDGQRASDLIRSGQEAEIPARPVTVHKAQILETKVNAQNQVEYALIDFIVSKGTYIRSLARDIANECNSAGHLVGLYRTRVGNFDIKQAAGLSRLPEFTIEKVIAEMIIQKEIYEKSILERNNLAKQSKKDCKKERKIYIPDQEELQLQEEIRQKKEDFSEETAKLCGFNIIHLLNDDGNADFQNGRPLRSKLFDTNLHTLPNNSITAVFTKESFFTGLIDKDLGGRIHYRFVVN